jgi:hypothetical protein
MGDGGYNVRVPLPGREFQMTVKHQRPVQQANFIDHQKIRFPVLNSLVKKITRDPRGTKFLSRVDVPSWGLQNLLMIDEEVQL